MNERMYLPILLSLGAAVACSSPRTNVTERDDQGHFVTTSDYQSMERSEFQAAMRAGLRDFEDRVTQLRARANDLGGDALKDFSEWEVKLTEKRTGFENQLESTEAVLADDWAKQRSKTLESYYDMRECLDKAYRKVLGT